MMRDYFYWILQSLLSAQIW